MVVPGIDMTSWYRCATMLAFSSMKSRPVFEIVGCDGQLPVPDPAPPFIPEDHTSVMWSEAVVSQLPM